VDGWVQDYLLIFHWYKKHPLDYNMLHRNKTAIRYTVNWKIFVLKIFRKKKFCVKKIS